MFPEFKACVKSEVGDNWFMSYPRWIDIEGKRICTESGLQPKEFILLPYIGVTDSTGRKAYKSDRVSALGYSNWCIEWCDNSWMLNQEGTFHYVPLPNSFTIIGNLHDWKIANK